MTTSIESYYTDLGARVSALRLKRNLSQAELGALLSPPLSRTSVTNIEAGKQRVLAHQLIEFGAALKVSPVELLTGTDIRKPLREARAALSLVLKSLG